MFGFGLLKALWVTIKNFILPSRFNAYQYPDRKLDPGEKFPWKYLSKKQIGNINKGKFYPEDLSKDFIKKIKDKIVTKIGAHPRATG